MRRPFLFCLGIAGVGIFAAGLESIRGAEPPQRKVLYYTRSTGRGHDVVYPPPGQTLSLSEKVLRQLGHKAGFEVEHTKDGRVFDRDLSSYDALVFYSNGSLTGPSVEGFPPVSPAGKRRLIEAILAGKGVVAIHTANASFISDDPREALLGGVSLGHGTQQKARMRIVSPKFPGIVGLGDSFSKHEEWYAFRFTAKDLHVILVHDTSTMKKQHPQDKQMYDRSSYPSTWARMHGQGRVFYTAMGHREDVWTNPTFQQILTGAIAWAMHVEDADVQPNMQQLTPEAYDSVP